jgi:hypothetical protein
MGLLLKATKLAEKAWESEEVRNAIGDRVFDFFASEEKGGDDDGSGLVDGIKSALNFVGGALRFLGTVWEKTIGALIPDFSFQGLWDLIVEAYFEIKNFDWNQSNADLEAAKKANDIAIEGAKGQLAGKALVWGVGGLIVGGMAVKWPVFAGSMALEVIGEGVEETAAATRNLITGFTTAKFKNFMIDALLTARRLEWLGQKDVYAFQNKKPWTIAGKIDERLEKIKDKGDRTYWTNFVDSVEDSIIDLGYVVSFQLDDHFAGQKASLEPPVETQREILLYPDPNNRNEYIYLQGEQSTVIEQVSTVMTTRATLEGKDVGTIVAEPYEEWLKASPKKRNLQIKFYNKKEPPYKKENGKQMHAAVCNIPDPKPLSWEKIKAAAKPYTGGNIQTTIKLNNGRKMSVWAVSKNEGLNHLKSLLTLSSAKMVGQPVHTEFDDSNLPPGEQKKPRQMWAGTGVVSVAKSTLGVADPTLRNAQNLKYAKKSFKLWVDKEEDSGFEAIPSSD